MNPRAVLLLLLVSILVSFLKISIATTWSGTFFIRADGTVDPPTAAIQRSGDIYRLTDDINMTIDGSCIVVPKDDVILDGENHTISGLGFGVLGGGALLSAFNVTARYINVYRFYMG